MIEAYGIERIRFDFVMMALLPEVNFSKLCEEYGISRRIGYVWLSRFKSEGVAGLSDRSRKPRTSPLAVDGDMVVAIIRIRNSHPRWGPRKIRVLLLREKYEVKEVPCAGTIARILKRTGLSEARGRGRPRRWLPSGEVSGAEAPNEVWTVDFKGWWRTKDGQKCEPLTVRDLYSRYILCVKPMQQRSMEAVAAAFVELFRKYGLPKKIRVDNGSPFASINAPRGLTRLSAWWIALGIEVERTMPGHPEQNGSHERMHLDMAKEIEGQPANTVQEEAKRLEAWRHEYNSERPHEAIGQKVPGEFYRASKRRYKGVQRYIYPVGFQVRKVRNDGTIRLEGEARFISLALIHLEIGIKLVDYERAEVWFCNYLLGELDLKLATPLRPTASAPSQAQANVLPMC